MWNLDVSREDWGIEEDPEFLTSGHRRPSALNTSGDPGQSLQQDERQDHRTQVLVAHSENADSTRGSA